MAVLFVYHNIYNLRPRRQERTGRNDESKVDNYLVLRGDFLPQSICRRNASHQNWGPFGV
jgi:hypothetical protein